MDIEPVPETRVTIKDHHHQQQHHHHTAKLIRAEIRKAVSQQYRGEIVGLMRWRRIWKACGDSCEAVAKGLGGASTILAFAASANKDTQDSDLLAFISGCVGTLSLVLLGYSTYATRESRQRTNEMNSMLQALQITPVPNIATETADDGTGV